MVDIPDDIPVAKRESSTESNSSQTSISKKSAPRFSLWWIALSIGALVSGSLSAWYLQKMSLVSATPQNSLQARAVLKAAFQNAGLPPFASEVSLLGHRQYEVAPLQSLVPITADRRIMLRDSAARRFNAMVSAARAENVILVPVSGFRSIEQQQYLFFGIKQESGLRADERAEVSAPPGYSEHHTGYAIDIVDGKRPDIGLVEAFETTEAFRWLQVNASFYSFELSFERDNPGNIAYEPWHWRFVGDSHSLETFYGSTVPVSGRSSNSVGQPQG